MTGHQKFILRQLEAIPRQRERLFQMLQQEGLSGRQRKALHSAYRNVCKCQEIVAAAAEDEGLTIPIPTPTPKASSITTANCKRFAFRPK